MKRIAKYQSDMALELLARARDAQDTMVIAACIRVRQGWLLGRRVDQTDLEIVAAFSE